MTIRRRVRAALFLMMLVPAFLMVGAFGVASRFGYDVNRGVGFARPLVLSVRERNFLREFNRLADQDPGSLSDPKTLASFDRSSTRERWGWRILRNGRELYRSSGFDQDFHAGFHAWAQYPAGDARPPDMAWDFRFPDGSPGTLQLSVGRSWGFPFGGPGWFAAFLAVVIGCNAVLGWWISSSVISPLARLRDAAIRIGEGDLHFRLAAGSPDEFGQVMGAFETMRGKLEDAVNRQVAEESSRKELIAHVSHDLRTPINLIRGYAEGIRDGVASTPEMRARYLATILERAAELERLIELLFSYSTLDLEDAQPVPGDVSAVLFLREMRDSLSPAFPGARISLAEDPVEENDPLSPRDLFIKADVELTRRVIANLVDNAVKHGGRAQITVQWKLRRGAAPRTVDVIVSDDGAGVDAADLPRIFEPFFRADRARSRQQGGAGAGLGLSIVRKLMEAQGGSVRAASVPGAGLEVTLTFPEAENGGEANPDH